MVTTGSRCSFGETNAGAGLPWTGEIEIDPEIVASIAETFSRLYRCGWSAGGIAVSFQDGACRFVVRGQIGESPVHAEGSTLHRSVAAVLGNGQGVEYEVFWRCARRCRLNRCSPGASASLTPRLPRRLDACRANGRALDPNLVLLVGPV